MKVVIQKSKLTNTKLCLLSRYTLIVRREQRAQTRINARKLTALQMDGEAARGERKV